MLIDHLAAGMMVQVVRCGFYPEEIPFEKLNAFYKTVRGIGRTAFPIFCFLLVEGFVHTKNRLRYALSLLIFGFISEAFFDVTFYAKEDVFNINIFHVLSVNRDVLNDHCNVYFTLLLGFLAIWAADTIIKYMQKNSLPAVMYYSIALAIMALFVFIAEKMITDYHGYGVALICIFYALKSYEPVNIIAGYLFISNLGREYLAFPGFILMFFYSHKRGKDLGKLKYLFYAFYPVHIGLIYLLRCFIWGRQ
ncbi:MAG: conjugal transfer protein TraX [Butyrivibrio sp.]|nr:conjugal transfer protein TraX [Butyrivibrio sp.]